MRGLVIEVALHPLRHLPTIKGRLAKGRHDFGIGEDGQKVLHIVGLHHA